MCRTKKEEYLMVKNFLRKSENNYKLSNFYQPVTQCTGASSLMAGCCSLLVAGDFAGSSVAEDTRLFLAPLALQVGPDVATSVSP